MNPKEFKDGRPTDPRDPLVRRLAELKDGVIQLQTFIQEAAEMVANEVHQLEDLRQGLEAQAEALDAEPVDREELVRLADQIRDLEARLKESEELLKVREAELKEFKSRRKDTDLVAMKSAVLEEIKGNFEAALAAFAAQARANQDLLEGKDSVLRKLEETWSRRIQELEDRLREKEELIKIRDAELKDLESKIAALSVSPESVVVLEEEHVVSREAGARSLRNGREEKEAKDAEESEAVAELRMIENFMRDVVKRPRTAVRRKARQGQRSPLLSLLAPVKKKNRGHGQETF